MFSQRLHYPPSSVPSTCTCGWFFVCLAWAAAAATPAWAVEACRVSQFGNGVQLWFEAEDFDQRVPDTEDYYPVVDPEVAGQEPGFGDAIQRTGSAGGLIRYDFHLGATGAQGGEWYFWGRVINPNNQSDYLIVDGDPGDFADFDAIPELEDLEDIPEFTVFPGGNESFSNTDDRIFEVDTVPPWGWAQPNHEEGHTKELRDGENSMFIFHRSGDATVFWDVFMWTNDPDYTPTDADYDLSDPCPELTCDVVAGDPDFADTHCLGFTLDGPQSPDGGNLAGLYNVTVDAADDSGDEILYTVIAVRSDDPSIRVRASATAEPDVFELALAEGTWTITVETDDDPVCTDRAGDASCVMEVVVVNREVGDFRVSQFGNGVQLWIEAEAFDERLPDTNEFFPVVVEPGASNEAVTRMNAPGGRLRYDFDIAEADGSAGTWYFWGRVINPNNSSDFLLVEFDPDDPVIPDQEPFPGGDAAGEFTGADDRIFEGTVGPDWSWFGGAGVGEGHAKELSEGKNSMFIFHRQGDAMVFWDILVWTNDPDYLPTIEDYEAADIHFKEPPVCPAEGDPGFADTSCSGLTIANPAGEDVFFAEGSEAGTFTVTVDAVDGTNDELFYTVTATLEAADGGVPESLTATSRGDNTLEILLSAGTWTIEASVDDDRDCDDDGAERICGSDSFTVTPGDVGDFRVSQLGAGVQLWFEAEAYDVRAPDSDDYFRVVPKLGASNLAINRTGTGGGLLKYAFDIDEADALGGTWYFWGRVINPNNNSDFMLVVDDPDDVDQLDEILFFAGLDSFENEDLEELPEGTLFTGSFDVADDRIFEATTLPPWGWVRGGHEEGHTKDLVDGENSMLIFHREGSAVTFWDILMWTNDPAYVPTVDDYLAAEPRGGGGPIEPQGPVFKRGDADANGTVDISDPISNLSFQFTGMFAPPCVDALDWDDNGQVEVTDPIGSLTRQFLGGDPAPAPGSDECGEDPTLDGLSCDGYPAGSCAP